MSAPGSIPNIIIPLPGSFYRTYGSGIIGSWLTVLLYGIATTQTYLYFNNYAEDSLKMKSLVWSLWIINTAHAAFTCHVIYHYLVSGAFQLLATIQNVWSLEVSVGLHLITTIIVMVFFVRQVFGLCSRTVRWFVAGGIAIPIALHLAFGIETIFRMSRSLLLTDFQAFSDKSIVPMLVTQLTADLGITISLCILLGGRRTGFKRTNSVLNTLIIYAINRCVATTAVALVELVALLASPGELWFVCAEFVLSGLFTNSLLASLNSRQKVRDVFAGHSHGTASGGWSGNTLSVDAQSQPNFSSSGQVDLKRGMGKKMAFPSAPNRRDSIEFVDLSPSGRGAGERKLDHVV